MNQTAKSVMFLSGLLMAFPAGAKTGTGGSAGTSDGSASTNAGTTPGTSNAGVNAGSNVPDTTTGTRNTFGTTTSRQMIMNAQNALSARGFAVNADGVSGPATQNAIRDFQTKNGLTATGQLDSATLNALNVSQGGGQNMNQ